MSPFMMIVSAVAVQVKGKTQVKQEGNNCLDGHGITSML